MSSVGGSCSSFVVIDGLLEKKTTELEVIGVQSSEQNLVVALASWLIRPAICYPEALSLLKQWLN